MYKKRRLNTCIITFIIAWGFLFPNIPTLAQFESPAGSAYLMEASTGTVLYEKNADVSMPPASITKIMTLLLGFEAIEKGKAKWDDLVPVSAYAWKMEGSKMFLEAGKSVKYDVLIKGISITSANDGCVALAEYLSGSEDAFVQQMNQRAAELGLTKSHFKNCNGLPAEGHIMSAKDIAVLAKYLIEKFPQILEIESQKEFTYNNILQYNRNPLLGVFQGADGLKTGWTDEAGYCIVSTAKQGDVRLIGVVLKTANEKDRLERAQELLNYGFKNFEVVKIKNAGDIVGNVPVKNGKNVMVPVKVNGSVTVVIPAGKKNDNNLKSVIANNTQGLVAPIQSGAAAGKMEVQLDGQTVATVDVYAAENDPKAGFFTWMFRSIGEFFSNLFKGKG